MKMPSPGQRRWAYRVTAAGLLVLSVYGIVNGEQIAVWSGLAAAILGLADANIPQEPAARHVEPPVD